MISSYQINFLKYKISKKNKRQPEGEDIEKQYWLMQFHFQLRSVTHQ